MKSRFWLLWFTVLALLFLQSPWRTMGFQYTVTRLTDNDFDDYFPVIGPLGVAWYGCPGNDCFAMFGNYEVYFWNWQTVARITDNQESDRFPVMGADSFVWTSIIDGAQHIVRWRQGSVEQLSSECSRNDLPRISGENVTWQCELDTDSEIYARINGATIRITDNAIPDEQPDIWGTTVVWVQTAAGTDASKEIMMWRDGVVSQLTNNSTQDDEVRIVDGIAVWEGFDGSDWEIFMWKDGAITQLTNNSVDDRSPQTANGRIVWEQGSNNNSEIMMWDHGAVTQLTHNIFRDEKAAVNAEGFVTWQGCPNLDCDFFDAGNWEIYCEYADIVHQLTSNQELEYAPSIYGNNITWMGRVDGQTEIFIASIDLQVTPTPQPTATPGPKDIVQHLQLNQDHFSAGDLFLLSLNAANRSNPATLNAFILLMAYDQYWFWPSWCEYPKLDYEIVSIPTGNFNQDILDFLWPSGVGEGSGLSFWSVMTYEGSTIIATNIDSVEFSYGF